jgi:stage IV sporulation protein FB
MSKFNFFSEFLRKIKKKINFFKIDFSFFLILFVAVCLDEISLYFYFVLFVCLHELSHYFVAKKLGYMASKIHLTFFGASLEGLDDFALNDEIKIVLAGPLFNFCIVILCYLSFWFYPESYHYLHEILIANWSIFLFNFLPIFPLDMGRLILSLLSKKLSRKDALKKTKIISFTFIILLVFLFVLSMFFEFNFTLGFVAVNLAFLLFSSAKDTSFKRSIFVKRKFKLLSKGLIERTIYVSLETDEVRLFKFIDDYHYVNFVFLDKNLAYAGEKSEIEIYKDLGLL